ncbi:hypothetical protein NQ315_008365 [Exocentrus adspersus]|uniref:Uncharacterized protein n=1 Tax=Exocentrus adspersus TaxID=1586481 RepID=A0AAV8VS67_9CUCU|nr:hypothetical protein NQ315_008365 [Exocentrus adspersus]
MKMRLDVKPGQNVFKEGDTVWLYQPQRKKGLSPKLQRPWEGPYLIVKNNDLMYRIQMSPKAKPKLHIIEQMDVPVVLEAAKISIKSAGRPPRAELNRVEYTVV